MAKMRHIAAGPPIGGPVLKPDGKLMPAGPTFPGKAKSAGAGPKPYYPVADPDAGAGGSTNPDPVRDPTAGDLPKRPISPTGKPF